MSEAGLVRPSPSSDVAGPSTTGSTEPSIAVPRSRWAPWWIAGLGALFAMLAACANPAEDADGGAGPSPIAPSPVEVGSATHEVVAGGLTRSYLVYRPQQVADPAPLVFVFHGHGGSAAGMEGWTGWNDWADEFGALIVYPEGVQAGFNAGDCCGAAQAQGVDDVAATLATIDAVAAEVPVDVDRIYSTGFSNGASMSYRLACETDRFAAIAPVAGIQYVPCESPSSTSVLHIHGLADATVPPAGQTRFDGTVVRPLEDVVAHWRQALQCEPATETRSQTPDGELRRSDAQCSGGRVVDLLTLDRLGHTWPDASDGLDATAYVSEFFGQHRR